MQHESRACISLALPVNLKGYEFVYLVGRVAVVITLHISICGTPWSWSVQSALLEPQSLQRSCSTLPKLQDSIDFIGRALRRWRLRGHDPVRRVQFLFCREPTIALRCPSRFLARACQDNPVHRLPSQSGDGRSPRYTTIYWFDVSCSL